MKIAIWCYFDKEGKEHDYIEIKNDCGEVIKSYQDTYWRLGYVRAREFVAGMAQALYPEALEVENLRTLDDIASGMKGYLP